MTIGLVFILNLEFAPYIQKYTSQLESKGVDFEIIYWDRLNSTYENNWKTIAYKTPSELNDNKFKKLRGFLKYRKFLINTLKDKKYDKVIILTTLSGILIFDFLLKHYKNKYIFDIRDYTFENNKLFKYIENKIINNSYFTSISSAGFKSFLPASSKYVTSHNILLSEVLEARDLKNVNNLDKPIVLSFIGAVRHFDIDKRVSDIFGDDESFFLNFHGYGVTYEKLKEYSKDKYNNIRVTGKYDRKNKQLLLSDTNIINSYYTEYKTVNKFAMTNKYYDSLIYKIPLWANPKVYMGKRAISAGIGINVYLNDSTKENMKAEYENINWEDFALNCDKELNVILKEDELFRKKLNEFINQ